jgi:adenosylcobinamide hydrolase
MTGRSTEVASHRQRESFQHRIMGTTLVVSFAKPCYVLSWAILNGGFRHEVSHIVNHQVESSSASTPPERTLRQTVGRLGLRGTVVGLMTAANICSYSLATVRDGELCASAITTAGFANLAAVGEMASFAEGESPPFHPGTINLIVVTNYRLTHEGMVEAVGIATEAKVRVMYEHGLRSISTGDPASGTGTDCIAVAVGPERQYRFCGKHTKWGELVGRASLGSIREALKGALTSESGKSEERIAGGEK